MEFFTLGLSRMDLVELYRALLAQFISEDTLRREQGLEPVDVPIALEKIEQLLNLSQEKAHALFHEEEAALWEYSWYTFTDEWAWFRARQDALKELGAAAVRTPSKTMEDLIEKKYEEKFDVYTAELDMLEQEQKNPSRKKAHQRKK